MNTLVSKFYSSNLNPVYKQKLIQTINVDSRFRMSYNTTQSSDFDVCFKFELKNVLSICPVDICLKNSGFNISSKLNNNYFIIRIENTLETKKIVIPDGKYTNDELIKTINDILNSYGSNYQYIQFIINRINTHSFGETIVGIKETAPLQFTFTLEFSAVLTEDFNKNTNNEKHINKKLGWLLGFIYDTYSGRSIYASESFINTYKNSIYYITLDDYNENRQIQECVYLNEYTQCMNDVILKINNTDNNIVKNFYKRNYFAPVNITKINIKIFDMFGRIVDLNNEDFNIVFKVEQLY